ncbi:hypothetical protein F66182_2230 [Fusarium sp. NRRL 66182]|nr:hypothetical protein F66182_2230 [Fusarium sp. NRRL 66182]
MPSLGGTRYRRADEDIDWDNESVASLESDANFEEAAAAARDYVNPLENMMKTLEIPSGSLNASLSSDEMMMFRELRNDASRMADQQRDDAAEACRLENSIKKAQGRGQDISSQSAQLKRQQKKISINAEKLHAMNFMIAQFMDNNKEDSAYDHENNHLSTESSSAEADPVDPTSSFEMVEELSESEFSLVEECSGPTSTDKVHHVKLGTESEYSHNDLKSYDTVDDAIQSRRVILDNIPDSINITQIFDGATGVDGILSCQILPTANVKMRGNRYAMIEFRTSSSARAYVLHTNANQLWFEDKDGDLKDSRATLIQSKSNPPTLMHPRLFGVGASSNLSGRCIDVERFPMSAVWWLIRKLGPENIVRVNFDQNYPKLIGTLSIEFISVFQAARFCRLIRDGQVEPFHGGLDTLSLGVTPSDNYVDVISRYNHNVIGFVNHDHLALAWDMPLFNGYRSIRNFAHGTPVPRRGVSANHNIAPHVSIQPSDSLQTSLGYAGEPAELDEPGVLHQFDVDKQYVLQNGNIYVTGSKTKNCYTKVQGFALTALQNATLQRPSWSSFWEAFCKANKLPDLRRWNDYGRVAMIRRTLNELQGFPFNYCQVDPKKVPVPEFIQEYTSFSTRDVVPTM